MVRCEQGYLCEVCGDEVEDITQSDLYLRFVVGEVPVRDLMAAPERHILCNPTYAQFIVDELFEPVIVEGPFDKRELDSAYVVEREKLITRGWQRLQELKGQSLPFREYPLPEFRV